ncbi:MAG: DUF4369 domain-containing protein [Winogradskyella sp.]|nr:DUF4369 domain-containing protein [Winogradskyella sp.]
MINLNKILSLIILLFLIVSCEKEKENNFTLKGTIKGLKKGVVYLQKEGDSSIVNIDSVIVKGQEEFQLKANIDEPIILYLKLFKNDGEEHYIPFFADKGVTVINSTLQNFNFNAKIEGSAQQKLLDEYLNVMSRFNNQNLDLIANTFEAQKANDTLLADSLSKQSERLVKRKYSYTIQFAMNNKNSEIAPYLALYEIPSANPIYIDSVYNVLTDSIKNSYYGKKLADVVSNRQSK